MLINLRNALMTGKRLPYDAELEYLESTGTQYIDTLVNADSNLSVEITMANAGTPWTNTNPTGVILVLTSSQTRHHLNFSGSGVNYYYGNINTPNVSTQYKPDNLVPFTFKVDSVNKIFTLGDYSTALPTYAFDAGLSYWLFGCNGTTPPYLGKIRICSAKLWIGATLVRDFIPVRKGTVGYLYDRVTRKLFGNAGTGDFVLGQDVVPVEWLEGGQVNGGIAFIDTGYSPNSSTKIESTSAILSASGYSGRYGNQSRLAFGIGNGRLYLAQGGHYFLGSYTVGAFYSFVNDIANRTVSVEGVSSTSTAAVSNWYPYMYPIYLFASNVAPSSGPNVNGKILDTNSLGRIRMKSCSIWENDIPVHNYLPIRVGTDATSWEGAMIDVLTRRIYRNAGTGVFGYGNDLKYPIPA